MRPLFGYRSMHGIASIHEPEASVVRAVLAAKAGDRMQACYRAAKAVDIPMAPAWCLQLCWRVHRHRRLYAQGCAYTGAEPNPSIAITALAPDAIPH